MTAEEASSYQVAVDLDGAAQSGENVPYMHMGNAVFRSTIFIDYAHEWIAPWVQ